ncbi:hypothetical protein D3C73_1021550 [compost metagenome]
MFGIPYIRSPPILSCLSNTTTLCPLLFKESAVASPAGPEPITATFLPLLTLGGSGFINPSSNALSIIDLSFSFIVIAGPLIPAVHAASHGAGHTLPVNSGKLFVFKRRLSANFHLPL